MNNTDKNRTVRPRTASKDHTASLSTKPHQNSDNTTTIRTVSRPTKSHEKPAFIPGKKHVSTPQTAPEKSTLGRKFASIVMQPAFEQVLSRSVDLN